MVEWSWAGHHEEDEASGRGWACLVGKDTLVGKLFFQRMSNATETPSSKKAYPLHDPV